MADEQTDPAHGDVEMTLAEHLDELRRRLIYALAGLGAAMGAMAFAAKPLLAELTRPFEAVMGQLDPDARLVVLEPTEAFLIYFRVALIAGLVVSAPWIAYHLWMFVAAGLYEKEKRFVRRAVPFSAVLFIAGAVFFLYVVSEPMLGFFVGFGSWLGVTPNITLASHVRFMTRLMLVFGLGFQTPLVVLVLARVGLVTPKQLGHYRRHVVVGLLVFAAVVTSPSPVDQVLLAVPMWLLYEFGIVLAKIAVRRRDREDRSAMENADEEE
jgi:sec-independent protein translocase protein TatC